MDQVFVETAAADGDMITIMVKDMSGRLVSIPVTEPSRAEFRSVISVSTLSPLTYFIQVTK